MDYSFTTIGALIGMAVAIILIIKKVQPAYSLILGALIGGVIGSGNLILTVDTMVSGAQSMISFCTENYDFRYSGGNSY